MEKIQTVLFLDNTYPEPYQVSTLSEKALGGTESSIVKTALILSKAYQVFVAQKYRIDFHRESENLSFIPKKHINKLSPDFIIVLRKFPLLKNLRKQFPKARLYLWIHTYKNTEYVFKRVGLSKTETTIICNSLTHARNTHSFLNQSFIGKIFSLILKPTRVKFCYNPIKKPAKSNKVRDINKLLFFSSPNKGLKQIVESFLIINQHCPDLRLYIANPGYKNAEPINYNANITVLGSLAHNEMMNHVKQSLCVFYPQNIFAETFGLIYAEANAYGTAVLAHDIGSAKEVLHENNSLIDTNNNHEIIETIKQWQEAYPKIEYNEQFSDKTILSQWKELFFSID